MSRIGPLALMLVAVLACGVYLGWRPWLLVFAPLWVPLALVVVVEVAALAWVASPLLRTLARAVPVWWKMRKAQKP